MEWIKEPPTAPGWYWIKSDWVFGGEPRTEIVNVFFRPGHDYLCISDPTTCMHTKRNFYPVVKLGAEWAGPIEPPKETE